MKIKNLSTKDNDAIRSIIVNYRNPFFTIDWLSTLFNPDHCLLCKMYFKNFHECSSDCPIIRLTGKKCSRSHYYKKILKYKRSILEGVRNSHNEYSFKDRIADEKKLRHWLNKTADKMGKSFLIKPVTWI